jgi:hypothetical protein
MDHADTGLTAGDEPIYDPVWRAARAVTNSHLHRKIYNLDLGNNADLNYRQNGSNECSLTLGIDSSTEPDYSILKKSIHAISS